ncbi:MAG: hypothetical protein ACRCV6_05350 [Formosimonas sp.]
MMSIFYKRRSNVMAALLLSISFLAKGNGLYDAPFSEEKYAQFPDDVKKMMVRDYAQSVYEGCVGRAAKDPLNNKDLPRRMAANAFCTCLSMVELETGNARQLYELAVQTQNPFLTSVERGMVYESYARKKKKENEDLVWQCTNDMVKSSSNVK